MAQILLVDDNAEFAGIFAKLCLELGHRSETFLEVPTPLVLEAALKKADLLFLDFWLNDKSSMDTLSLVRSIAPELPVVIVSGGGKGVSLAASTLVAEMTGAIEFVYKPFGLSELREAIFKAGTKRP